MTMSIKIAETAGFCYGVKRAVGEVYRLVEEGERIGTLGELIHNHTVIDLSLIHIWYLPKMRRR